MHKIAEIHTVHSDEISIKAWKSTHFSLLPFPDAGLDDLVEDYVEDVKAFIKTENGSTIMVDQQGYEYQVHSRKEFPDERIRWRCRLYRTSNYLGTNCTGGAWTLGNKITKFHKEHIHPSFVHRDDP